MTTRRDRLIGHVRELLRSHDVMRAGETLSESSLTAHILAAVAFELDALEETMKAALGAEHPVPGVRYRLRSIMSDATKGEVIAGVELDACARLKEMIFVRYDETKVPPAAVRKLGEDTRKYIHPHAVIVPSSLDFFVVEPIPED